MFSIVKELHPEGVYRRTNDLQRKRHEYIVPGPDYIWSIDGHDKLAEWGIQIYAAIDAYSRYIVWIYVGISNRTSRSLLLQYLFAVQVNGKHPRILRSDRGTETPLCAELHYALSRTTQGNDLEFKDCYYYGSSTKNQRIESWWAQLEKSLLHRWRVS
jgi:hypothetical protein